MKKFSSLLVVLLLMLTSFTAHAQDDAYGDVNNDGEVNIVDVDAVINIILGTGNSSRADVNNDGEINIVDVNAIIDIILGGGGYDGENEGGIVESTELEQYLATLSDDEDNAPLTTYSYADSLEYDELAQEVITLFAPNDSDEADVQSFKRVLRSQSEDDLAQDAIRNNGKNIFSGSLTIEQLDWNSGLWGKTRYGEFETYYNTHVKNGRRCLLIVFYYKGGFPNSKTAYIKLGQVNSGKIVGQIRINSGTEYAFLSIKIDDFLSSHGIVNFFPLIITNGSQARNYLNPITVKTNPLLDENWRNKYFGYEFGTINGVSVYYNKSKNLCVDGDATFQCVELCRRYITEQYGFINRPYESRWGNAKEWPNQRRQDEEKYGDKYMVIENDGHERVREGDIIVWDHGYYGHVGVVIKTAKQTNGSEYISVAHQNGGTGNHADPIGMTLQVVDKVIKNIRNGSNYAPIFTTSDRISHFIRVYNQAEEVSAYSRSLTASTTNLRFGKRNVNTSFTRKFTITNHGYSPLTISSMTFNLGKAYKINMTSCTIGDGETREFEVTFTPSDPIDYDDRLIIRSDADDNPVWCIQLSGKGVNTSSYVDLGLPSGTLWATCNVGASAPEDYGYYFAWGETAPKDYYDDSTYKWCNGSSTTYTKYCTNSDYGYNGFVDNKTELDPEDDAAYVNWGPEWRMPTIEQQQELINNCTSVWTTQNGVNGQLLTGPNGNTLFLPAAGSRFRDSLNYAGKWGFYLSRSLYSPRNAFCLYFYWYLEIGGGISWSYCGRGDGITVRAVRVSQN